MREELVFRCGGISDMVEDEAPPKSGTKSSPPDPYRAATEAAPRTDPRDDPNYEPFGQPPDPWGWAVARLRAAQGLK